MGGLGTRARNGPPVTPAIVRDCIRSSIESGSAWKVAWYWRAAAAMAWASARALADGRARGFVDRVFPVAQAEEAFAYMGEPGKFGKVLLQF